MPSQFYQELIAAQAAALTQAQQKDLFKKMVYQQMYGMGPKPFHAAVLAQKKPRHPYKEVRMPEIEVIKTGGVEKELMLFTVDRVSDGLRVKARSRELGRFFEQYQSPTVGSGESPYLKIPKWGGMPIRKMDKFPVVENASFAVPGEPPMVNEYITNLSFLRAEKLEEGIEFVFKGVFSNSQAESFYEAARTSIKELFLEYLQSTPFEYTLTGRSSI